MISGIVPLFHQKDLSPIAVDQSRIAVSFCQSDRITRVLPGSQNCSIRKSRFFSPEKFLLPEKFCIERQFGGSSGNLCGTMPKISPRQAEIDCLVIRRFAFLLFGEAP